jgi:hypothetical protein
MLAGLLTLALASATSSFAQSNAATASDAAPAAQAPKGAGEGIKVYGQWTIEIRNRDGSIARHVEFENALTSEGPAILSGLLFGSLVPGSWALVVDGSSSPCSSNKNSSSKEGGCVIVQEGSGLTTLKLFSPCTTTVGPVGAGKTQPFCYSTLNPSETGSGGVLGFSSFTLSGEAYADTSTSISSVLSGPAICGVFGKATEPTSISPSGCFDKQIFEPFTQYDFSAAANCGKSGQSLCTLPVQAGQVISATVTFSFSSPSGDGQAARVARTNAAQRDPNPARPFPSTPVNH